MIVWVYRNLRHGLSSRPLYSVMYKGRVIRHTHKILLRNAEFKVRARMFMHLLSARPLRVPLASPEAGGIFLLESIIIPEMTSTSWR
jgi:hypothetical protein